MCEIKTFSYLFYYLVKWILYSNILYYHQYTNKIPQTTSEERKLFIITSFDITQWVFFINRLIKKKNCSIKKTF